MVGSVLLYFKLVYGGRGWRSIEMIV
jgi:hypothetical protein